MKSIGNIYLAWRAGTGKSRHIVGVIRRNVTLGTRFAYISNNIQEAMRDGFTCYTDFPDLDKEYSDGVLEKFGQRLTKPDREDIQEYYNFWNIKDEYKNDKYYLLAHTQGLLATDNYEFLAEYRPVKGLSFVSDICGLSHITLGQGDVNIGDQLTWKKEIGNNYDKYAIQVYKGDRMIGYIKRIHNKVFHNSHSQNISLSVKSIVTGVNRIQKIFIVISIG